MGRFRELFSDVLVATGAAIVVFSVGLVMLILIAAVPVGNPYIGVFTFIFLPIMVVVGGIIFVFGVLVTRQKDAEGLCGNGLRRWLKRYAVNDFKQPRPRRRLVFFLSVGVVEVLLLSLGGMRLAEHMDTAEFCGQTCHKVMRPEYTVYQESPHARVPCVDCHIGSGAPWLVRSKVSGVKQLFVVLFDKYPRPLPSPVANLRPARETCEVCHWPQKFSGDLIRVSQRYDDDENNTLEHQVIALRVGGGGDEVAGGIHWHVAAQVWYLPLDEKRQQIGWVGVDGDGKLTEYYNQEQADEITPQRIAEAKRLMDCIDCHNRATHIFYSPDELLEQAITQGRIDPALPFIKKQGRDFLNQARLDAAGANASAIEEFYRTTYPEVSAEKGEAITEAIAELERLARLVSFPEMEVDWETHLNNLGHRESPGCFRCHGKLRSRSEAEETIDGSCNICHYFLPSSVLSP